MALTFYKTLLLSTVGCISFSLMYGQNPPAHKSFILDSTIHINYNSTGKAADSVLHKYMGIVVVTIAVDSTGNVISATYNEEGSTTHDPELIQKAVNAAKQAKFNKSPKPVQTGKMTVKFKLK